MKKRLVPFIALLLVLLLLGGCAASSLGGYSSSKSDVYTEADKYASSYYAYNSATGYAAAPQATPMPMPTTAPAAEPGDSVPAGEAAAFAEKIIYSASATVETTEFDSAIAAVYDMIADYGGFIENSSVTGSDYYSSSRYKTYRSAYFVIRVPQSAFEAVSGSLDVLGNVTKLSTTADNITSRFMDVEARLKAYTQQEERLLELFEAAETVEDMITVETRLAEVRYEIESLTSTLKNWQNQVDYSTVTLNIDEVEKYTPEVTVPRGYGEKIGDAFTSALTGIGDFFKDAGVALAYIVPILLIPVVILVVVIIVVRKRRRRAKAAPQPPQSWQQPQYPQQPQQPQQPQNPQQPQTPQTPQTSQPPQPPQNPQN